MRQEPGSRLPLAPPSVDVTQLQVPQGEHPSVDDVSTLCGVSESVLTS